MSKKEMFEERYKTGVTPWELDRPDANLIQIVQKENINYCKALDIGCGTGNNAIWLSQNGFDVTGIDFSPLAIDKAKEKSQKEKIKITFSVVDFLKDKLDESDFGFIFDRGCFHSFESKDDRNTFAKNACEHLKKGGLWYSLLGNADDEPREDGPPTRSAMDIVEAIEPYFEIVSLMSGMFDSTREKPARCWKCLMKRR
ncbi:MAG: class I SAM-dependent methyltransferase [Desulfobacteraceae bacterium]|nr:class I SAM-dependent methyltransferase [Desulfobacteraceae bacterium]